MIKGFASALLVGLAFIGAVGAARPAAAQQFSADMVTNGNNRSDRQKIYVSDGKLRLEPPGPPGMAMIADGKSGTGVMVATKIKAYADLNTMRGMIQMFMTIDPQNPCPQWQKMEEEMERMRPNPPPQQGSWSCKRIGNDTVGGRSALKYEATSATGETGTAWIDPKLKFMIKAQGAHGGMELQNIKEGPQPASLFAVPSGYQKLAMPQLMQQIMPQRGAPPPGGG